MHEEDFNCEHLLIYHLIIRMYDNKYRKSGFDPKDGFQRDMYHWRYSWGFTISFGIQESVRK